MRLGHRVRTSASPAQVWEVLGSPGRWGEFDLTLRKVRGAPGPAAAGQVLVGVSRVGSLPIPVDVVEAVPGARLSLRVHLAPGVVATVTYDVLPVVQGGSDIRVGVVLDGLFARGAVVPVWTLTGLTTRLLGARVERLARASRRVA